MGKSLAADDTKKTDEAAKQIEGDWQGVSLEQDGNKNDDAKLELRYAGKVPAPQEAARPMQHCLNFLPLPHRQGCLPDH